MKKAQVEKDKYKIAYKKFEKGALAEWRKAHPDSSDDESEESSDDDAGPSSKKRKKKKSACWKNF